MIPQGGITNAAVQEVIQPSLTWKLDMEKGKIAGKIDGLQAVKQAVFCALNTERYKYLIHTWNYGAEFDGLIGKNPGYVRSEIRRRIEEALTQDDRIRGIEDLQVAVSGNGLLASFVVRSDYGNFEYTQEVKV